MTVTKKKPGIFTLADLKKGEAGEIVHLSTKGEKDLLKFLTLGLIPGEKVTVIHRVPLFVIQVGHTQIALDVKRAEFVYISTL